MFKPPKNNDKYVWTAHVVDKMLYYGISESRIKRIIRFPTRVEEGIADDTIAVMQPTSVSRVDNKKIWKQEIWVMYKLTKLKVESIKLKVGQEEKKIEQNLEILKSSNKRIKIITAWRYPGMSSERDPIPDDVLNEIRNVL